MKIRVLKLSLHGHLVGYLAGYDNGKNVLTFAQAFVMDENRPTMSLTTRPDFPYADKIGTAMGTSAKAQSYII